MSEKVIQKLDEALEEAENEVDESEERQDKKEFKPDLFFGTVVKSTQELMRGDTLGRVTIIIATALFALYNSSIGWLQGQGFITSDTVISILLGIVLYIMIIALNHFNNWVIIKLNTKAAESDKVQAEVLQERERIKAEAMSARVDIARKNILFAKNQDRIDLKLTQDLKFRLPFLEEAQQQLWKVLDRKDVRDVITIYPALTEQVKRMDNLILQRADYDVSMNEIKSTITEMGDMFRDLSKQTKENAEILNQVVQEYSSMHIKTAELDLRLANQGKDLKSLSLGMDSIIELLSVAKVVPSDEKETFPDDKEESTVIVPDFKTNTANDHVPADNNTVTTSKSISNDIEQLLDEELKKKDQSEEDDESILPKPP